MTTFNYPLKVGKAPVGNPAAEDDGYVALTKGFSLGVGAARKVVTFPPKTTLRYFEAIITSAFTAETASTAMNVNFGSSAESTTFGMIQVSGDGTGAGSRKLSTFVSGATTFDSGGSLVVTLSALSTTTFTAGGVRVFIHYFVGE